MKMSGVAQSNQMKFVNHSRTYLLVVHLPTVIESTACIQYDIFIQLILVSNCLTSEWYLAYPHGAVRVV